MSDVTLGDLLRSYEKKTGEGAKFATKRISGTQSIQTLSRTARRFAETVEGIGNCLTVTSTRTYGLFLITFGIVTLLLHFVKDYMDIYDVVPLSTLIIGGVFLLAGIPLVAFDKPLAFAMQEFPVTEFIFFEFFCLPVAHKKTLGAKTIPAPVGLVLGLLLAILGAIVPLIYVALAVVGLVYIYLSMLAPEFSFYLTFLLLPYFPLLGEYSGIVLAVFVFVTIISFVRKVASGKRVFFLESYDIWLFVMLLLILISGIFVKGIESFTSSLTMTVLGMAYCLTSSLVTNRRLADGVVKAITISSVPVSLLALYQSIRSLIVGGFESLPGSSATFDSPDTLGIFLLICAVFSAYFISARRQKSTKVLYTAIFLLTVLAMVSTLRPWLFVTALVGVIVYAVLKLPRGSGVLVALISILPYCILFAPSSWLVAISEAPFAELFELDELIPILINSRKMFIDNIFSGVGIGKESFSAEYFNYAYIKELPTSSGNFLLQIACEAGVFALVAFLLLFATRLRHRNIYSPYVNTSEIVLLNRFSFVGLTVLLVYGLLTSLWSDMTMYFLFFVVFGLGSAALRVSKQEYDDRVAYFSDGAGVDASTLDITLK